MPPPTGTAKTPPPPPQEYNPLAAFLSYLVPGLGQIYQGRIAKGFLFLVCVHVLFFYGMALGGYKNVYLGDTMDVNDPWDLKHSSWPLARLRANLYNRPQFLGQVWVGVAAWPAILQYYRHDKNLDRDPVLGTFERQPSEELLNTLQIESDKTWDLAWVYTVIAGVLNVLVIYDALAGPAFAVETEPKRKPQEVPAV